MEWSPHNAIEAYLQTLHMCKVNNTKNNGSKKKQDDIEPQGLELISALAAGNQANVIVQVTTSKQAISPLTLALAVAANQTNGKLICIIPTTRDDNDHRVHSPQISTDLRTDYGSDLRSINNVDFRVGDPCDKIKDLKNVDFVVIDPGLDPKSLTLLFERIHINPKGGIIVANNVVHREQGVVFVDQVLRGMRGVESSITTIPLGSTRVQVIIRIKCVKPQRRRHKRFLVTFDG